MDMNRDWSVCRHGRTPDVLVRDVDSGVIRPNAKCGCRVSQKGSVIVRSDETRVVVAR
jgi:hypothetical protein